MQSGGISHADHPNSHQIWVVYFVGMRLVATTCVRFEAVANPQSAPEELLVVEDCSHSRHQSTAYKQFHGRARLLQPHLMLQSQAHLSKAMRRSGYGEGPHAQPAYHFCLKIARLGPAKLIGRNQDMYHIRILTTIVRYGRERLGLS